jgi:hypothetical protein
MMDIWPPFRFPYRVRTSLSLVDHLYPGATPSNQAEVGKRPAR